MEANTGWFSSWFANGWFPAVWFAPADESHVPEEELQAGYGSFTTHSTKRLKRKRIFIDGKEHFLNPLEVASLLIERAAAKPEAGEEAASIPEVAESPAADPVYAIPAVDYEAVRARADVQASQVFIDRMNAEIERMHRLAVQRQLDEEDDIECLMLLL